jgi:branched-chain amino acid transport system permease protein
MVYRFLGVVFLGVTAIFGTSAYLLMIVQPIFHSYLIAMVVVTALTSCAFVPLTYLLLRTKGPYFALLTLGLNLAIPQIFSSLEASVFRVSARFVVATEFEKLASFLVVSLIFAVLLSFTSVLPKMRQLYLKLLAIRADEDAAKSLGIDAYRYRFLTLIFLLLVVSFVGSLHVLQYFRVDPSIVFNLDYTVIPLVGGLLSSHFSSIPILLSVILALTLLYYYLGIVVPGLFEIIMGLIIFTVFVVMSYLRRKGGA